MRRDSLRTNCPSAFPVTYRCATVLKLCPTVDTKTMSNNLGAILCVSHGAVGADGCHDDTDVVSETSPSTEFDSRSS